MYNHAAIIECLRGLVGFESDYNVENDRLDDDLILSSSGIYANNLHPLLTHDNILQVVEQFSKVAVRDWNAANKYKKGDVVEKENIVYYSLFDDNLNNEVTDAEKWRKTNLFSAYLRRLYDASVVKLFSQVFTEKKLNEVAKSLLGQVSLYEGVGNITGRITKNGRMVGFKIGVKNPDTIATLSNIGLQLDTVQNNVKIYIYHTSSDQPLKVFTINHTKSIQIQWHSVEAQILAYLNDNINAGESYYITYYEDELTGSAIRKDYSFGSGGCGTCSESIVNNRLFNQWSKYVSIQPFYINAGAVQNDRLLWNADQEIYTDDTTWGMNLQLSVQCDVTDLMCRNRNVLTNALSQQLVVDLLTAMAYSTRDNGKRDKIAGLAAVAIDNQENGQYGEVKKLSKAIQALSFDFSSLSQVCLPCNNQSTAMKKRTVWG